MKNIDACGGRDAGEAERREGRQIVRIPAPDADDDEHDEHRDLDHHHDGVRLRRLADPADQECSAHDHEDHGGQVEHAALFWRVRQRLGHLYAEHVVEELVDVLRPSHGDGRARDAPFEQQAGADSERRQLTERGVGVGVRRARHRDGSGQLCVTDCGQAGYDSGYHERPDHGRPCHRNRLAQDEEDAGADRAADTDGRQTPEPDRALEFTASSVCAGFGRHLLHRLATQHLLIKGCHGSSLRSLPTVLSPVGGRDHRIGDV